MPTWYTRKSTDQGMNFIGELFQEMCRLLHNDKSHMIAYHPECSIVERNHQKIMTGLSQFIDKNQ